MQNGRTSNGGGLVLIADDDTDFRLAVAEVLTAEGFVIITASTGRQVVDVVMDRRPDVVLLDHRMPEMSGMDACRSLRRRGYEGPVILMTAGEDIDAMSRALGTKYRLEKPFDVDDLVVLVRRAAAEHAVRSEALPVPPTT
jgi:DNA-binding NtrC family response regulator